MAQRALAPYPTVTEKILTKNYILQKHRKIQTTNQLATKTNYNMSNRAITILTTENESTVSSQANEDFQEQYMLYRTSLYQYLLRLTKNPQDAADITQETFIKFYQNPATYKSPKAWLFRTGYHLFIDNWRKGKKYTSVPIDWIAEPASDHVTPEQVVVQNEENNLVMGMINQLHPKARFVLLMRVQYGASYQEIAERVGCPENTIKSVIRRSRLKIRKWMEQEAEA